MKSYTSRLLAIFFALIFAMAAFELLVDPYDTLHGPRIAGFNAKKTRRDEDGRRVTVGQAVVEGGHGTILTGTSRAVDGFPRTLGPDRWPGGLYDAGIRGTGAFEISRALALAGRSPDLRCVVVGLEYTSYSPTYKGRSTYWITPLPDGSRFGALARTALSPHAFWRSVQTISDNLRHHAPKPEHPLIFKPGEQRKDTLRSAFSYVAGYRDFQYDPQRLEFLSDVLKALSGNGVQVIGVVFPSHILKDEAEYVAGRYGDEERWLAEVAQRFAAMAQNTPVKPCVADRGGAVLWDFSGFRMGPYSDLPSETQTVPQPYFYEAAHFTPLVGMAMLDRVLGRDPGPPFGPDFGEELTPAGMTARNAAVMERRTAWLQSGADMRALSAELAKRDKTAPPTQRVFLPIERDDWQQLKRDLKRMAKPRARAKALH